MAISTLSGGATGGPTMWVAIRAKDNTQEAFRRVEASMNKLSSIALSTMRRVGTLSMSFATLGRMTGMLTNEQARAIGVFGTVISIISTVASVVKALTAIEWAHVAALTWKVALLTLGVGVAIAAAAAMAVLAMQTQNAADAQGNYNVELEKGANVERRRTANRSLVRRGLEYEIVG